MGVADGIFTLPRTFQDGAVADPDIQIRIRPQARLVQQTLRFGDPSSRGLQVRVSGQRRFDQLLDADSRCSVEVPIGREDLAGLRIQAARRR